jgi:hypothetical protein
LLPLAYSPQYLLDFSLMNPDGTVHNHRALLLFSLPVSYSHRS